MCELLLFQFEDNETYFQAIQVNYTAIQKVE